MEYIGLLVGLFLVVFAVWFWGTVAYLLAVAIRGIWHQMTGTTPKREDAAGALRPPGVGGGTPGPSTRARGGL